MYSLCVYFRLNARQIGGELPFFSGDGISADFVVARRGDVDIVLRVDGKVANTVRITIR